MEPPTITPAARDTRAEVRGLLAAALEYLRQFSLVEAEDNFEAGYRDPFSTAKPQPPQASPEAAAFESQRQELLACLETFASTFADFLTAHHDWRIKELQEQYGQAWRECRTQRDLVESLTDQLTPASNHLNGLKLALAKASAMANGHDNLKPKPENLPSQNEIELWESKKSQLTAAVDEADKKVTIHATHCQRLARQLRDEKEKWVALSRTESDLRARLAGDNTRKLGFVKSMEL